MPQITNKKTGISYSVSENELVRILANPLTAKIFKITRAEVPEEVKQIIEKKAETPKKAAKPKKTSKTKYVQV